MALESLNKRAANSFEKLREQKGWAKKVVEDVAKTDKSIDEDKLQKMLDSTPSTRVEVENIVHHGTDRKPVMAMSAEVSSLDFIGSLELSANLSIAIACILDSKKKGKKALIDAQEWIEKELRNE